MKKDTTGFARNATVIIQKALFVTFLMMPMMVNAQQPPGTEIYVFTLQQTRGTLRTSEPINITQRAGYDNQPFFHPDQPLLYFTSAEPDSRTNLHVYNLRKKTQSTLTTTPEREYSPTVTPDKKYLSCIIQRDNGKQDLGKYPIHGGNAIILIDTLTIGYHAWATDHSLIAFVLGQPNSLHLIDFEKKSDAVLATGIGRSLHKIPGEAAMSFTQKNEQGEWLIQRLDLVTLAITTLTTNLPGNEHDIAWTPDGKILSSDGQALYWFDQTGRTWKPIIMPPDFKPTVISRLAVNSKGNLLAVVMNE